MTNETPTHEHPADQATPKITIHTPTPELLRDLAGRLSADDLAELEAVGMKDPLKTLTESVAICREAYVACWDGAPQAAFGVADLPLDDTLGVPWLLSTGAFAGVRREFLDAAAKFIAAWAPMYSALFNFVHTRHVRAQRWLVRLGFEPYKTHEHNGNTFIEFGRFSDV